MMAIYGMLVWASLMTIAVLCLGFMVRDLQYATRWLAGVRQLDIAATRGESVEDMIVFTPPPIGGVGMPNENDVKSYGAFDMAPPPAFMQFGIAGDGERQAAWENSNREHFVTCGGCGSSVRLKSDLFTLEDHDCDYDPENSRDALRA